MNLEKIISYVAASIFGWVFISLPKVANNTMTWVTMLSSIGLAGVVGFIGGSTMSYFFPHLPGDVVCSITSILGATCQHWMNRFTQFADRAADRVEEVALDMIGKDEHEEPKAPDHPAEDHPKEN